MNKRKINLVAILLVLIITSLISTGAYASSTVTLPQTDGILDQTMNRVLSLMQTGGFNEADEFKKQYVDYYGGMSYFNNTVTLYTTDIDGVLIKQLEKESNIEIKRVDYSLNQLNKIALEVTLLGKNSRINGYSSPPVVNVRENRVDLLLNNNQNIPSALSADEILKEVNAGNNILDIRYHEEYEVANEVTAINVPKTGDKPYAISVMGISLITLAGCMFYHHKINQ